MASVNNILAHYALQCNRGQIDCSRHAISAPKVTTPREQLHDASGHIINETRLQAGTERNLGDNGTLGVGQLRQRTAGLFVHRVLLRIRKADSARYPPGL